MTMTVAEVITSPYRHHSLGLYHFAFVCKIGPNGPDTPSNEV
jgi:hypothetical protein